MVWNGSPVKAVGQSPSRLRVIPRGGGAGPKEKWGQPCGRPHSHRRWVPEGTLIAWRFQYRFRRSGVSIARRSRRCRFHQGLVRIARIFPVPPGGSETDLLDPCLKQSCIVRRRRISSAWTSKVRPFRLCALAVSTVWDFELLQDEPLSVPTSHPSTTRLSPSRRSGSKIPSSSPVFRPLLGKSQSPSRCLEGALGNRFGQARTGGLIHLRRFSQWTRVDNSTVRRTFRGLIPGRVAPTSANGGH